MRQALEGSLEAELLQDGQRAGGNRVPAGLVAGEGRAVDEEDAPPSGAEQAGGRRSGRAPARDDDVEGGRQSPLRLSLGSRPFLMRAIASSE